MLMGGLSSELSLVEGSVLLFVQKLSGASGGLWRCSEIEQPQHMKVCSQYQQPLLLNMISLEAYLRTHEYECSNVTVHQPSVQ